MNERILKEAGIRTDQEVEEEAQKTEQKQEMDSVNDNLSKLEQLEIDLHTAIETENYEKAAKIRDQISKMKG